MKSIKLILAAVAAVAMASCVRERGIDDGGRTTVNTDPNKVQIELSTDAGTFSVPEKTRAGSANEDALDATTWVAVFNGNDDNATFREVVQATATATTGKYSVTLTKSANPSRVLIIANPPASFADMNPTTFAKTTYSFNQANLQTFMTAANTFGAVMSRMSTTDLTFASAGYQSTVPYVNGSIPTTAFVDRRPSTTPPIWAPRRPRSA